MCELERRDFLKLTAAGAAASVIPGAELLFAQDTKARGGAPILICVYLRGGQDALNVVVPHGDKRYAEIRPTIAIPAKDSADEPGVIPLDDMFGLHPSMKALKEFWDAKKLAPIVCAGSPHQTRSHFDAQDFMEYAAPGLRTVKMGWLNRYLKATREAKKNDSALRAVAMQGLLPRALRGEEPVLAVPERNVLQNEKVLDTFEDVYGKKMEGMEERKEEDPVVATGRHTLETLKKYKEIVEKRRKERKTAYPAGGLGRKLQDIASLILADAGLEVAAVDYGGWDHHANEANDLERLLPELAGSMAAFGKDIGDALDHTLLLVMTEFGRTCRENGNAGTDHGHGGAMFAMGGAVKGGKVHGKWNGLEDKALYEARDLPVTTDFRDVFCEVLRSHMKWEPAKDFFPDFKPQGVKGLF